jgi:hypothetical protein
MNRSAETGGEHGSRFHAVLNFWGLILAAFITAAALLWANFRQESLKDQKADFERQIRTHGEEQKQQSAELERQLRALQQARAAQTPGEADAHNKRLQKEIQNLTAKAEASEKRAAELESKLLGVEQQLAAARKTPAPTLPPTEVAATKPSPVDKTIDMPPPRQKLEHFIVEVTRAQTRGENATVYLKFTNTTTARLKMLLADGFLGRDKTFLVDDIGQRFTLDNSSGIGSCCFGFAGGDWNGAILDLAPKGGGDVTLTFRRRNRYGEREREPQNFTLTAELTVGDSVKLQTWHGLQWQSSGSAAINIAGITPR